MGLRTLKGDPQLPEPGELIGAKYRVERLIGLGGMGAVYEASHRVTGKRFALKLLLPELTAQHDVVKRFIREAQVAGRFQHPNAVEIYDIGEYGDSFFMVMELLVGVSLATRLERDKKLSIADACEIVMSCLDAVAFAHAAGIIHRDLKPANIFLCETRTPGEYFPKVLDFGISKLADQPGVPRITVTDSGTVMGTPFYMAPEQLRSADVDHRVDIYALGVTLYELLSGNQPFVANNYPDLVIKIWTESPVPLEAAVPGIPPLLASAVSRAMARDAADRFSTAEEMALALTPFAHAQRRDAPALRPLTASARAPRPVESHRPPKGRPPDLDTTQRTPFASESLATPRMQMKRSFRTHRTRWLIGACMLAAVGYGAWRGLSADELPRVQAAPRERLQPTAAEPAARVEAAVPPAAPAAEVASAPLPAVTPPAQEPEEPRIPPPTAARRRSPPQPVDARTDPVLPLQRPSPSIDRTQF